MLSQICLAAVLTAASESQAKANQNIMENVLPEHVTHTAWVFETEVGPHEDCQDYHFDAAGFEDAMRHSKKLLSEAQDVIWCRLRPYGLDADEAYEVTLD